MNERKFKIGILALQGAFKEHCEMFEKLGVGTIEIRKQDDLKGISGIVIPGGESTTMSLLIKNFKLIDIPIFGTCAGAVLLAKEIDGRKNDKSLGLMNIEVKRNAYGSQLESFEEDIEIRLNNEKHNIHAIYIRAPQIIRTGGNVEILARNNNNDIILVKEKNILVSTFHPELTGDSTIHQYFLSMITQKP